MAKASGKVVASRRARVATVLPMLRRAFPDAKCSLDHSNPLELLAATILSAQCTDVRVNLVTPELFRKYPTATAYAAAPQAQLERDIRSTGFYRNKATALRGMGAALDQLHHGQVPQSMEELTMLPGVGRKTANVILGNAFQKNVGVVVDTHVARVSARLGLTKHADPVKIEADLMAVVPQDAWTDWSHLLIFLGRRVCQARKPRCPDCPLRADCPSADKFS